MLVLDGKQVAQALKASVVNRAQQFKSKFGRNPGLGVILVGEDPASQVYVRNKENACESVGFFSERITLAAQSSETDIIAAVQKMNQNPLIDGFLVQLPLPRGMSSERVIEAVDPLKDADALTSQNLGLLFMGNPRVAPCTPSGVMKILQHYKVSVGGKHCVVIGRSNIVGKPMAQLLVQANATVTVCHSHTKDLKKFTREADIVVVAAGRRHLFGLEDFKEGGVVIDVGIHGSGAGAGLAGDVRFHELSHWSYAVTPVPGGVGPMTIACLLENTMTLAELGAQ